jgi:hypothetical protein
LTLSHKINWITFLVSGIKILCFIDRMEIESQEIKIGLSFWMGNLRIVDRKDDVGEVPLVYSFCLL